MEKVRVIESESESDEVSLNPTITIILDQNYKYVMDFKDSITYAEVWDNLQYMRNYPDDDKKLARKGVLLDKKFDKQHKFTKSCVFNLIDTDADTDVDEVMKQLIDIPTDEKKEECLIC